MLCPCRASGTELLDTGPSGIGEDKCGLEAPENGLLLQQDWLPVSQGALRLDMDRTTGTWGQFFIFAPISITTTTHLLCIVPEMLSL